MKIYVEIITIFSLQSVEVYIVITFTDQIKCLPDRKRVQTRSCIQLNITCSLHGLGLQFLLHALQRTKNKMTAVKLVVLLLIQLFTPAESDNQVGINTTMTNEPPATHAGRCTSLS